MTKKLSFFKNAVCFVTRLEKFKKKWYNVNCISMKIDFIWKGTNMKILVTDDEREILSDEISLMRFGHPEEIAKIALFLAKEDSSFITGQIITADGCML